MFGTIAVAAGGARLGPRDFGGVKPKQVLEILLAARGHPVPKDRLAEYLWSDSLPRNVSATLETYVSVLRRRISCDRSLSRRLIVTQPEAYRFASEQAWIDLDEFDRLTGGSRGRQEIARSDLERALTLARGDLLEDEPYAEWMLELRDHYRERVVQTLLAASGAALAERDLHAALHHAETALGLDRFLEPAYRLAMVAYYALGQPHDALKLAARCRGLLADEIGTNPGAGLQEAEQAILADADPDSLLPEPVRQLTTLKLEATEELPFLGRARELAQLEGVLERALKGSFELVLVAGDAGMGKSRLLDEFGSRQPALRIGRGTCSGFGRRHPFVPLAMALRAALADIEIDAEALPALTSVLPELGLSTRPHALETQALESLVALIRQSAPLVLIRDDLHLADEHTIAALDYLAGRCAAVPLVVLASFRPEEAAPGSLVRLLRHTLTLELGPLRPEDLAAAGLSGLYERTKGHPYYLNGVDRGTGNAELSVAVHDFVLARCRAAGEQAYGLLLAASVLAEPFELDRVTEIAGLDKNQALDAIETLCRRGVLRLDGTRLAFQQQLEREVLYRHMSAPRRLFLVESGNAVGAELCEEAAAITKDAA
jgi:DNA-binding SARP family transcriptional activator